MPRSNIRINLRLGRLAGVLICTALILLFALPADAQQPTKSDIEAFESHVKRGSELLDSGDYREGIDQLEKAREIIDHPRVVFTIADAYRQWGRCEIADSRYRDLLARKDVGDDMADRIRADMDRLDSCIQKTTLIVECEPPDARVEVADQEFACGDRLNLEVGEVTVKVNAPGYRSETRSVKLTRDEVLRERISLQQVPTSNEKDSSGVHWQTYAGFGSLGLGSALLIGGFFSDVSAVRRGQNILTAQQDGDTQRVAELEDEARRAKTRTAVFYITGAVAVSAGVVLLTLDQTPDSETAGPDGAQLQLGLRGLGLSANVRW